MRLPVWLGSSNEIYFDSVSSLCDLDDRDCFLIRVELYSCACCSEVISLSGTNVLSGIFSRHMFYTPKHSAKKQHILSFSVS